MPKILLIEDDTNLAFMIADGMEAEGFETKTFASAEEALPAFLEFKPDIVFTDVNLKGEMDGFELARRIRKLADTPVIFITSRTQVEDLKKGYEIGNIDYLKKPFGISELLLRTNELLSRVQTTPSHSQHSAFIGRYSFLSSEQLLCINGEKIHLNPTETKILDILNRKRNDVVSKLDISKSFASTNGETRSRRATKSKPEKKNKTSLNEGTFYNAIASLREKLSKDEDVSLDAVSGMGYRLTVREE
jgi:two-component system, OmpR family, response regulator TrcR